MKEKKKVMSILLATVLLLMILVGATYAYFQMQGDNGANVPTTVQTGTTDSLVFEVGTDITVTADMSNFGEGMGNQSDSTFARATLKANNKTNSATDKYNLFFIIDTNELAYTTESRTPELILKVTDPKGNEVTNIDGLTYKTFEDGKKEEQRGFDITTRTGGFKIASDYEIVSTGEEIQNWNIEVILVNLDSNQSSNGGKSLSGKVLITKNDYEVYKLAHINTANTEIKPNSIKAELDIENGTTEVDKYYYAIEEVNNPSEKLEYIESNTNINLFENLKEETTYKIYTYVEDMLGYRSNVYETEITTSEYVLPQITNVEVTSITHNSISVRVTSEGGTNEVTKYHFIKNSESYGEGQASNTYIYSELSEQTQYKLRIKVEDSYGRFSTEYTKDVTTKKKTFSNYIKSLYTGVQGENNIYYHKDLENSAEDGSYRYAGSYESVNNYVCFGYDDSNKKYVSNWCPNDNLYRIIGVFGNQVKLIKADFATATQLGATEKVGELNQSTIQISFPNYKGKLTTIPYYYWSASSSNMVNGWADSTLNTNALNNNFLGTFSATWQKRIATTNWKVGGNTAALIRDSNAQTAYTNEITNPVAGQTAVSNKIGLMYVSDYYYAASPTYWIYPGWNSDATKDYRAAINANWMYLGVRDWTISRSSDNTIIAFGVNNTGDVCIISLDNHFSVRPVFYLNFDVVMIGGSGTKSDPYRIS